MSEPQADAPRLPPGALRVRADAHGVVVEREAPAECLRFDAQGRWIAWHRGGEVLRRGVLGDAYLVSGGATRALDEGEAQDVARAAARTAGDLSREVSGEGRVALERAAAWDAGRHEADRARARAAHPDGVPILPPHRYRDVIVEPARGCPNANCTFCAFYRGREFVVLDDAAFEAHLRAVDAFWGPARAARDGVFLGSASAASLPDAVLLRRLARVERWAGRPRRGVASFFDPDRAPPRDAAAWARLASAGLCDLTLGLETGDPALRREVGKNGDLARFAGAVGRARAAGVRVAVCVLLGLGGAARAVAHRDATVAAVRGLALGPEDLVYLSLLAGAFEAERGEQEMRAWKDALAPATRAKVAAYRAEGFVAWA